MSQRDGKSPVSIGFLTIVAHEQHGYYGGYLVLNHLARPLELHCTAPVKANRAQEILYGPTLEPYLFGEQIGQTLVAKSDLKPVLVCTDRPAALALRHHVDMPVTVVLAAEGESASSAAASLSARLDAAHAGALRSFSCSARRLAVKAEFAGDESAVRQALDGIAEQFDFLEPFERIRGAIEEAQRGRS